MCLRPVHIKTSYRSRYFYPDQPATYSSVVPCGNCLQCKMSSRNDMYLRTLAEYNDCVSKGGKVLFLTFTYSEDNVPCVRYSLCGSDVVFESVPRNSNMDALDVMFTFRKPDLQSFYNSLRKNLERRLKSQSLSSDDFLRYITVGEYGSRYTQRPHYHALLFLSSSVCSLFDDMSIFGQCSFLTLCRSLWSHGTVSASDKGLVVDNDFCCGYVSKYIGKSLDILKLGAFSRFFDFVESNFSDISITDFPYKPSPISYFKALIRISGSRLFVLKSKSFGLSLINPLKLISSDVSKLLSVLKDGISVVRHSKTSHLRYPKYILSKLFYNNRSDGSYYLSDLGLKVSSHLVTRFVESSVELLRKFDYSSLYKLPSDLLISNELGKSTVSQYVMKILSSASKNPYKYFIYNSFVRGRVFPSGLSGKVNSLLSKCNSLNYKDIINEFSFISHREYFNDLFRSVPVVPMLSADYTLIDAIHMGAPYSAPVYISHLDEFLDVWSAVTSFLRGSLLDYYEKINQDSKVFKDLMNFNLYGT